MSTFTSSVLQRLTAANAMRHLFDNQMRMVQSRTLSGGGKDNLTVIRVPYESPSTQWKLVGLPEFDKKSGPNDPNNPSKQEWSYYNGFQLFATEPVQKQFRQEFKEGPLYTQEGFPDDHTFAFNLVHSEGTTEAADFDEGVEGALESKPPERHTVPTVPDTPRHAASSLLTDTDDDESTDEDGTEQR